MSEILRNQFVLNEPTRMSTGEPTGNRAEIARLLGGASAEQLSELRNGLDSVQNTNPRIPPVTGYVRGAVPDVHQSNEPQFTRADLTPVPRGIDALPNPGGAAHQAVCRDDTLPLPTVNYADEEQTENRQVHDEDEPLIPPTL